MREILFRGKVIDSTVKEVGEWVYGHLVVRKDHDDGPEQCFICEEGHRFIRCLNKMPCTYKVDPESVGQYIGEKDENSKHIFEGDIVAQVVCKYTVEFEGGAFFLIPIKKHNFYDCPAQLIGFGAMVEVIGNIHDNPELLDAEVEG